MKKVWIKHFLKFIINANDHLFYYVYSNMEAHIVENEIST